jgi:hypothetical protein
MDGGLLLNEFSGDSGHFVYTEIESDSSSILHNDACVRWATGNIGALYATQVIIAVYDIHPLKCVVDAGVPAHAVATSS